MIEIQNIKLTKVIALVLFLLLAVSLRPFPAVADSPPGVHVRVEGKPLAMPVPPTIMAGRTLVAVPSVGEAVGVTVTWDQAKRQATITRGADIVVLTLGKQEALVNEKTLVMEVPA